MIAMLKKMTKNKEFLGLVISNENITSHLLKVFMMKCGFSKILLSIIKLMIAQMDMEKTQNILYSTIMKYLNKYG